MVDLNLNPRLKVAEEVHLIRWVRSLSLTMQLVFLFIGVGLTPLLISIGASYFEFSKTIEEKAIKEVSYVGRSKLRSIEDYFISETDTLKDLSTNPRTAEALESFSAQLEKLAADVTSSALKEDYHLAVEKFYQDQFLTAYKEKSGRTIALDKLINSLDPVAIVSQYDYIVKNPNPLGKKNQLMIAQRESLYSQVHEKYHPNLQNAIDRHGWYDLFLVDMKGRVVYSVFKETDFGTSLSTGPWKESGLARAFEKAKTLDVGSAFIEDYSAYAPSYESPASFAVSPIFKDGKFIGAVISQLPLDKVSAIATDREGLGKNGDVILFGADLKLRADSFRNKETHSVALSFKENSQVTFTSESIGRVLQGESGTLSSASFDGLQTLAFYSPVEVLGLKWFLVIELDQAEVFSDLKELSIYLGVLLLIGVVLVTAVAILFGRSIGKKLKNIALVLEELSGKVTNASQLIAVSSQQLSSASSEQASSLEETAASLNEISSMVAKSTENAKAMAAKSLDSEQKAEMGKKVVDLMMTSMNEINISNEAIMNQIQSGNARMSEIMKVIQEIGSKTKVINEIVFQTKLLSFNASVEAARAGEHGKGFAVVAEEVGNLAKMSGVAAKEISEMLDSSLEKVEGITSETKSKVDALMSQGKQRVESGVDVVHKCADVLNEIIINVSATSSLSVEVSTASLEQSQGVTEINKAIGNLDSATQQNAAVSESTAASAEDLSKQATELKSIVNQLMGTIDGVSEERMESEQRSEARGATVLPFRKKEALRQASPQALKRVAGDLRIPSHNHGGFEDV